MRTGSADESFRDALAHVRGSDRSQHGEPAIGEALVA
jgi:hypothetical protein